MTERLEPTEAGIARAATLLAAGRLVAFPTETVYGLGADARMGEAVAGIFAAKDRPSFNPLIVHVADGAAAAALVEISPLAERLIDAFWPGALTLVLPLREAAGLSDLITAGLSTVAVRAPAHPLAQRLLAAFPGPIAAPSANPSGKLSPTTAAHVVEGLGGRIDAVLDGGPCPVGIESTIIGFEAGLPCLLRAGGTPVEAIEAALGERVAAPSAVPRPTAPGQLASHYAPGASLRLGATAPEPGEAWLGFGPDELAAGPLCRTLSPGGDLREAAAALFATLRELDAALGGAGRIAVAIIPEHGLGRAINDRLRRAAAPRDAEG
ncbi:MAG: L-threonylcarbamoyladenylate synthase [Pseudomonadota bacterium]